VQVRLKGYPFAATARASCDLARAALFGWIRRRDAARSRRAVADRKAVCASSWLSAVRTFFRAVRRRERARRFRSARAWLVRMRFSADLMLGKRLSPSGR
jgi:hypothetical protein